MTIRRILLALAASAICAAGTMPALAADNGFLANALFDRLDTNHDGVISRGEIEAARARIFDRLDTNHDGVLTAAEIEAAKQQAQERAARRLARLAELRSQMPTMSERLAKLDKNHDGKVSRSEFVNGPTPWFDRLSKDGNGVTKAEVETLLDDRQ